jgi:hypothetical protein
MSLIVCRINAEKIQYKQSLIRSSMSTAIMIFRANAGGARWDPKDLSADQTRRIHRTFLEIGPKTPSHERTAEAPPPVPSDPRSIIGWDASKILKGFQQLHPAKLGMISDHLSGPLILTITFSAAVSEGEIGQHSFD